MVLIRLTLRYHFTGRFWDILRDLAEVGSFPESHASPSANNKRIYGSDEPVESPPDNTSEASPKDRGPIAGSKRVSSSIGSARRDTTSANASSPTLATTLGTQDLRGDPSIFSVTGSVSTPEKTGSIETSGYSSPGAFTTMFNGDALPITTNDLGKLPLHHGIKLSTNFNFEEIANGWNASGSSPREQLPEDLFPWISYTGMVGAGGATADPVLTPAIITTTTKLNGSSEYITTNPDQSQQTADGFDSAMESLFGNVPSTSFTAFGQTAGLLPGTVSNATGYHTDLFGALFPPLDPPVGPSTTMQTAQQSHNGHEERGYGSLPVSAQAYLHGWSNAPQAFE